MIVGMSNMFCLCCFEEKCLLILWYMNTSFEKCKLCGDSNLNVGAAVTVSGRDVSCQELENSIFAREQVRSDSEFCSMSINLYSEVCCIQSKDQSAFDQISDGTSTGDSFTNVLPAPTSVLTTFKPMVSSEVPVPPTSKPILAPQVPVPPTSKPVPAFDNWYGGRLSSHSPTILALSWIFWCQVCLILLL